MNVYRRATRSTGFTLMEVLIATAVLGTAYVALVSLQAQTLSTMSVLTQRLEAGLWAQDAFARYTLIQEGYTSVEPLHPRMRENHVDWTYEIATQPLSAEDMPFVPVLPVGWKVEWVDVQIRDHEGRTIGMARPLWAHSASIEDMFTTKATPTSGGGTGAPANGTDTGTGRGSDQNNEARVPKNSGGAESPGKWCSFLDRIKGKCPPGP